MRLSFSRPNYRLGAYIGFRDGITVLSMSSDELNNFCLNFVLMFSLIYVFIKKILCYYVVNIYLSFVYNNYVKQLFKY